ncbi:StbB family protein [Aliivibrio fischeri]|uniref:StbB family protein n=1 Tax=Aliivibrio fischeri TaxID=668 RepID=UPI0007C5A93C|nr:StbB family protein [Aliivibrio fischeri]MBP3155228.1 StbB [Aliivibrio fischeri]MCE7575559.1 StbB [Aliivibrio fischeri]
MKIAVINFSGNVGKSVISQHLLQPRMNDAKIIAVESINSDGTNNETIKGKEFADIMESISEMDDVIVDIGASNVEDFMKKMKLFSGSQDDFDYFIVPTINKPKQLTDTQSTINELHELDIDPERIKVVFNMVDIDDNMKRVFADLIDDCDHMATINTKAIIYENELFTRLKSESKSIAELINDDADYKTQIQATDNRITRRELSHKLGTKRLAIGVSKQLDNTFKVLFGKKA